MQYSQVKFISPRRRYVHQRANGSTCPHPLLPFKFLRVPCAPVFKHTCRHLFPDPLYWAWTKPKVWKVSLLLDSKIAVHVLQQRYFHDVAGKQEGTQTTLWDLSLMENWIFQVASTVSSQLIRYNFFPTFMHLNRNAIGPFIYVFTGSSCLKIYVRNTFLRRALILGNYAPAIAKTSHFFYGSYSVYPLICTSY